MNRLGIIAGMGPMAGVNLYKTIIDLTEAKCDQGHIPFLLYNLPQIPDRTRAILYGEESPLRLLVHAAKTLEKAGVEYIILACNTAHFFIDEIQSKVKAKILNVIDLVWEHIHKNHSGVSKVGLLATNGVLESKIYSPKCGSKSLVTPSKFIQEGFVMKSIYGIKAGNLGHENKKLMLKASSSLVRNGAELIIMGCSEIPLILTSRDTSVKAINSIEIIAIEAIRLMKDTPVKLHTLVSIK